MFLPLESPERVIDIWKMRNVYLGYSRAQRCLDVLRQLARVTG